MTKAIRPQAAAIVTDVEACIAKWKSSRSYLENVDNGTNADDDNKTTLTSMPPESMQLFMAPHYKEKATYEEV